MKSKVLSILIVEDDVLSRLNLKSRLESHGLVIEADNSSTAKTLITAHHIDVAFIDLDLEHELAGLELIKILKQKKIHSIVLSGREDEHVIEQAYELGCSDFLSKPYNKQAVEAVLTKFSNIKNSDVNLRRLKEFFMTSNEQFLAQLKIIEQSALGQQPILITGETGTGKTFLAKFIHQLSGADKTFVHLNCAEISETLMESELFGHEKGAFTGAIKDKKGFLELANGGTLFLDEIATLPLNLQKKLLKAIDEKSFYPVGSEKVVMSSFRLISATCEDLKQKVAAGEFRQDFLFRIEGFNLELKSLRDRKQDLPNIVKAFLKKGSRRIILSKEALDIFLNYSWPGNIRELEKTIEILKTRVEGIIMPDDLKGLLNHGKTESSSVPEFNETLLKTIGLNAYIEKLEARIVQYVLTENGDKVRKTMSDLKISNNSFYRIMTNIKSEEQKNG